MASFFGLHNYSKPGKGISKDAPKKKGIALYFEILMIRFWKLMLMNIFFVAFSIPAIVISFFLSTCLSAWAAAAAGIDLSGDIGSAVTLIGLCMTFILVLVCGTGPASAGMTYVLKKYVNDKHSWVWGDFIDNFKSNFKQSIAVYIINLVVSVFLIVGYIVYTYAMNGMLASILRGIILTLALIFILMQMYTYQLIVGFRLSVKKIYKNAAILTILKLPWNIFSAAVSVGLMYYMYKLLISYPPIAFVVLLTLFYSSLTFTQLFMTNNVVKKYMLEPLTNQNSDKSSEEGFDSEFED